MTDPLIGKQPPGRASSDPPADDAATVLQRRLDRLQHLAQAMAAAPLQEILDGALVEVLDAVDAAGALVALPRHERLEIRAATGWPPAILARFASIDLSAQVPLAAAARSRQPVWVLDRQTRSQFAGLDGLDVGTPLTGSLPMTDGARLLGVLGVAFPDGKVPTMQDTVFLAALARAVGAALAQALRTGADLGPRPVPARAPLAQPSRVAEIERLGLWDPADRPALDRLTALAARLLGSAHAQLTVVAGSEVVVSASGLSGSPGSTPVADTICAHTVAAGIPINIPDAAHHPWARWLPPVASGRVGRYLGVPVRSRTGEIVASLCVFDAKAAAWPDDGERVLADLALTVTAALEHDAEVRDLLVAADRAKRLQQVTAELSRASHPDEVGRVLYRAAEWPDLLPDLGGVAERTIERIQAEEASRRARVGSALVAEASVLLDSELDVETTLAQLARVVVPALADACVVRLKEAGRTYPVAVAHVDRDREQRLRAWVRDHRDPAGTWSAEVVARGRAEVRTMASGVSTPPDDAEPLSAVCVPLHARGRVLGSLEVFRDPGRLPFDEHDDLALLQDVGGRAGTAIDNAVLHSDLRRATSELESALLPPALPAVPGMRLAAAYLPAATSLDVGGDFYDAWTTTDDDGATVLWAAVGDVCGRGARAAALTGVARHTLRAVSAFVDSPAEALHRLNHALHQPDRDDAFCTAVVLRARPGPGDHLHLVVGAGGHPYPYLVHRDGTLSSVAARGDLVGVWPQAAFEEVRVVVDRGDQLVLYTDGVTEARGDGGEFGDVALPRTLRACAAGPVEDTVNRVTDAVARWRLSAADDVAMLAIGREGLADGRGGFAAGREGRADA